MRFHRRLHKPRLEASERARASDRERERRVLVSLTRLEVAQRLRVSVCLYYPATPSKSLSRALSCKIVKSTSVKSAARKRSRQRNIPPPCPLHFPPPLSRAPLPSWERTERRREIGDVAGVAFDAFYLIVEEESSQFSAGNPGRGGENCFFSNLRAVFPREMGGSSATWRDYRDYPRLKSKLVPFCAPRLVIFTVVPLT